MPPPADLPLVETFHSLQGEGIHAGRSAFFLRLAGCDVGCSWCDTKVSWPESAHPRRSLGDLAAEAREAAEAGAAFVVITGGEPLQHNLTPLCVALDTATALCPRGSLPLHLETSGVHPLSGRFDWITLSPKRHRPPRAELLTVCHELKVVVHETADLTFAVTMAEAARSQRAAESAAAPSVPPQPALLLQPGWDSARGQELAVAFVRRHPDWRLSLQTHKWLRVR
ncbi:MAG: 7-carboxy-7-deazaguanine synthase QueE [Cyanobium sp.]